MSKERRLGRGLEALLGRPADAGQVPAPANEPSPPDQGINTLSVYEIDANPYQPRKDFDDEGIDSLSASLREHGMIQAIVVRQDGGRHQLISGERRLRAAIKAGWSEVPVRVIEADDRRVAELAIVENLQRKDLNALEKAASFQDYLETYQCTQEELAARLKIDRSTVANLIRLLELPSAVQDAVRGGTITQGHARALLPLGEENEQVAFCEKIKKEGLSVRATEQQVQDQIHAADAEPLAVISADGTRRDPQKTRNDHLLAIEQELRSTLGFKVDLRQSARGKGKVVIHFKNHDEFERLRSMLGGQSEQHIG